MCPNCEPWHTSVSLPVSDRLSSPPSPSAAQRICTPTQARAPAAPPPAAPGQAVPPLSYAASPPQIAAPPHTASTPPEPPLFREPDPGTEEFPQAGVYYRAGQEIPPAFLMYLDWWEAIRTLPYEQQGRLLSAMYCLLLGQPAPRLSGEAACCLAFIRQKTLFDEAKWRREKAARRLGGKRSAQTRAAMARAALAAAAGQPSPFPAETSNPPSTLPQQDNM